MVRPQCSGRVSQEGCGDHPRVREGEAQHPRNTHFFGQVEEHRENPQRITAGVKVCNRRLCLPRVQAAQGSSRRPGNHRAGASGAPRSTSGAAVARGGWGACAVVRAAVAEGRCVLRGLRAGKTAGLEVPLPQHSTKQEPRPGM